MVFLVLYGLLVVKKFGFLLSLKEGKTWTEKAEKEEKKLPEAICSR